MNKNPRNAQQVAGKTFKEFGNSAAFLGTGGATMWTDRGQGALGPVAKRV